MNNYSFIRRSKRWLRLALMPLLIPTTKWYLKKQRVFSHKGLKLTIPNSVFHPGLFFSTKFLIRYLEAQNLNKQSLLELGAGSGLISMYCHQQGANVTASDINKIALEALAANASYNQCDLTIVHSDLFDHLESTFDWIIINPPYYPRKPQSTEERAWFCGEDYEYFHKLGKQLPQHIHEHSKVLMVLSEDCAIAHIKSILHSYHIDMQLVTQQEFWLEQNYIFALTPLTA